MLAPWVSVPVKIRQPGGHVRWRRPMAYNPPTKLLAVVGDDPAVGMVWWLEVFRVDFTGYWATSSITPVVSWSCADIDQMSSSSSSHPQFHFSRRPRGMQASVSFTPDCCKKFSRLLVVADAVSVHLLDLVSGCRLGRLTPGGECDGCEDGERFCQDAIACQTRPLIVASFVYGGAFWSTKYVFFSLDAGNMSWHVTAETCTSMFDHLGRLMGFSEDGCRLYSIYYCMRDDNESYICNGVCHDVDTGDMRVLGGQRWMADTVMNQQIQSGWLCSGFEDEAPGPTTYVSYSDGGILDAFRENIKCPPCTGCKAVFCKPYMVETVSVPGASSKLTTCPILVVQSDCGHLQVWATVDEVLMGTVSWSRFSWMIALGRLQGGR